MENKIISIANQFGISFKNIKTNSVSLSQVFILDGKYVLRARELSEKTIRDFKEEISVLKKIEKLIPYKLPKPLKALNGQKFVISNNCFWTIYPFIKGKIICPWQDLNKTNDLTKEKLIKALRNIHDLTMGKFKKNKIDYFSSDITKKYNDIKNILSPSVQKRIKQAIKNVINASKKFTANELCFVHGDFHHGNILVDKNDKIIGFLDLDWCRVGHPLEDLSYTIMMFLRDYASKTFQFNQESFQKFLKWYNCDQKLLALFKDYFILSTLYDIYIFKHTSILKNKKLYFNYQLSFLKAVCNKL